MLRVKKNGESLSIRDSEILGTPICCLGSENPPTTVKCPTSNAKVLA